MMMMVMNFYLFLIFIAELFLVIDRIYALDLEENSNIIILCVFMIRLVYLSVIII